MRAQPRGTGFEQTLTGQLPLEVDVVVPMTTSRGPLPLLGDLLAQAAPPLRRIIVVDQRLEADVVDEPFRQRLTAAGVCVIPADRLPALALQNEGARAGSAPWIAFLDEDLRLEPDWLRCLACDLDGLPPSVVGVQGRLSLGELGNDDKTTRAGHATSQGTRRWDGGDLTLRRRAFEDVGGFDPRFAHADRRDVDLCLRLCARGLDVVQGRRRSRRLPARARALRSLRESRVRIDEMQLYARHGPRWRELSGVFPGEPKGLFGPGLLATSAGAAFHTDVFGTGCVALGFVAAHAVCAARRYHKGAPSSATGLLDAAVSSTLLPLVSLWHATVGVVRGATLDEAPCPRAAFPASAAIDTILIDEELLLTSLPTETTPRCLATAAVTGLARVAHTGCSLYVLAEEFGPSDDRRVARDEDVAIRARCQKLVDGWLSCPHRPGEGCLCRRPSTLLLLEALELSGSTPDRCLYVTCDERGLDAAAATEIACVVVPHPRLGSLRGPPGTDWAADLHVVADRLERAAASAQGTGSSPPAPSRLGGLRPIDLPLQ